MTPAAQAYMVPSSITNPAAPARATSRANSKVNPFFEKDQYAEEEED